MLEQAEDYRNIKVPYAFLASNELPPGARAAYPAWR
jgi:hypothetical protein